MARFRFHSPTLLFQISFPLLLLIFIITIHPSYGDEDDQEPTPWRGMDILILVCNYTSDNKFCVDNLSNAAASFPWAKASEITNSALRSGQGRADEARSLIASLLQTTSAQKINRQPIQICQLLNNKTIEYLTSAADNLNSDSIDSMVEDLNEAANATKSCQDIIQGPDFSVLANKNSDIIKFCEIAVVSKNFFSLDDFE
ncbi:hypothetical protein CRYUN_Cryun09bG0014400 [Craigia yunnanensis]